MQNIRLGSVFRAWERKIERSIVLAIDRISLWRLRTGTKIDRLETLLAEGLWRGWHGQKYHKERVTVLRELKNFRFLTVHALERVQRDKQYGRVLAKFEKNEKYVKNYEMYCK